MLRQHALRTACDFPRATRCGQQLIAARWRFQRPTITARPLRTACNSPRVAQSCTLHRTGTYPCSASVRFALHGGCVGFSWAKPSVTKISTHPLVLLVLKIHAVLCTRRPFLCHSVFSVVSNPTCSPLHTSPFFLSILRILWFLNLRWQSFFLSVLCW